VWISVDEWFFIYQVDPVNLRPKKYLFRLPAKASATAGAFVIICLVFGILSFEI